MAKVRVRFVGAAPAAILSATPDHPSIQFQRYGQLVELDSDVYQKLLAGHYGSKLALISDEEFQALGHPASDLTKWGSFESHQNAPKEFLDRRENAITIMAQNHKAAEVALAPPTEAGSASETDTIQQSPVVDKE